jgi:hypothetical protein
MQCIHVKNLFLRQFQHSGSLKLHKYYYHHYLPVRQSNIKHTHWIVEFFWLRYTYCKSENDDDVLSWRF